MKYFLSAILTFSIAFSFAQSGNFLLSHYSPNKDRRDNVCFQMAQMENGIIYFATRSGLLSFDGRSWDHINGNGAIYTLQVSAAGTMYWGGANGFGIVSDNKDGLPELTTLSEKTKEIFQSLFLEPSGFFLNEEKLFVLDLKSKKADVISSSDVTGDFTGIFQMSGTPYVNTSNGKVFRVEGHELVETDFPVFRQAQIIFSAAYKEKQFIGLSSNEIYQAEKGKTFRKVVLQDQDYLNENVIVSGSWVNDDLIVLGTLRGGLVFINLTNGRTNEIINYSTGLPDNEIFSVVTDRDQSVWAAHEYGFTRIAPHLPFRSFSYYPGLSGNLLCAMSFQNSVYVGTSLGLYKLEKEDLYQDGIYNETVPVKDEVREKKRDAKASAPDVTSPAGNSKRKGFFRWFRKKETTPSKSTAASIGKADEDDESLRRKNKVKTVLKSEKVLVTSTYRYKKVNNINAKITQLLSIEGRLIACGLEGTFEINGLSGKRLIDDPSRYIYGSRENVLFVSTYSDEIKTLQLNAGKWNNVNLLQNLSDQINHIFEGRNGELWLCALDKIYRIKILKNEINDLKVVDIENPAYDEFVGIELGGKCIVANANGFYQYDPGQSFFVKIDSLSKEKLSTYFSRNESIWYRHTHGWNMLGNESGSNNLGLLNLFKNIRFITSDEKSENLWVITNNNELYKYFPDRIGLYQERHPLVMKTVRNGDQKLGARRKLDVDHDNSRLTFEVVQPDFLAAEAIEYRYHITGLDQDWTDWSQANNVIEIPYLPSGEYSLEVESRDIFGKESSLEKIAVNVLPPYWKRPWFYALEVLFFSLLVLLSFRLSTRYRIISRLLMLLTIILLIQFVETIIGQTLATTTSPVIDFLIQVVIAMMILPVEGYLRELMLRSLDTSNRFYRFIAPKVVGSEKTEEDFD